MRLKHLKVLKILNSRFLTVELAKEARGRRREVPIEGEKSTEDPLKVIRNEESSEPNSEKEQTPVPSVSTNPADQNEAEEELLLEQSREEQNENESDMSKSLFDDFEMEE